LIPAAEDSDTATAQIIGEMSLRVHESAADPAVCAAARDATARFGRVFGRDSWSRIVEGAFSWPKHYLRFEHHELLLRRHIGPGHLQGLVSPDAVVRLPRPAGDCAIFSSLIAAFLECQRVGWEFVTVAVNPRERDVYSHVYVYAIRPAGERIAVDASHGRYVGWQVPSRDVFRRQVWNSAGSPVPDQGSRFAGLHAY